MSNESFTKYLMSTPADGGEYYTLRIPEGVNPPKIADKLALNGVSVEVFTVRTPDDIAKGRGGPVARSMRENGIAYDVNCLPEGHEYLNPVASRGPMDTDLFQCADRKCGCQARYREIKPSLECPECKKKNKKSPMYNTEEEKTAAIVERLDKIADEVQVFDEKLALEIDKITDDIESSF